MIDGAEGISGLVPAADFGDVRPRSMRAGLIIGALLLEIKARTTLPICARPPLQLAYQLGCDPLNVRVELVQMPVLQHLFADQPEAQIKRHHLIGRQDGCVEGS
jgi:hypothetical protein